MQTIDWSQSYWLCTPHNSHKRSSPFIWRMWLLAMFSNPRTSSILFNYSTKTTRENTIMMSTCPKMHPNKTILSWSQEFQLSIRQSHHKVTLHFQISWAAIQIRRTEAWKTKRCWTTPRSCTRDGTGQTTCCRKSISKILWRRIRRSTTTRSRAQSTSIIQSTHSRVISGWDAWKRHFKSKTISTLFRSQSRNLIIQIQIARNLQRSS